MLGIMVMDTLIEALGSKETYKRLKAQEQLVELGTQVVPALLDTLYNSTNNRQRAEIITTLALIKDHRAVVGLIDMLEKDNLLLRMTAAKALAEFADPRVVLALIDNLPRVEEIVQLWIALSLGKLGDQRAVKPLLMTLHQTPSSTLRHTIIRVLGELGDSHVIKHLLPYLEDEDQHVQNYARLAIERLEKGK